MDLKIIVLATVVVAGLGAAGFWAFMQAKTASAEAAYFRNDRPACLDCGKEY